MLPTSPIVRNVHLYLQSVLYPNGRVHQQVILMIPFSLPINLLGKIWMLSPPSYVSFEASTKSAQCTSLGYLPALNSVLRSLRLHSIILGPFKHGYLIILLMKCSSQDWIREYQNRWLTDRE